MKLSLKMTATRLLAPYIWTLSVLVTGLVPSYSLVLASSPTLSDIKNDLGSSGLQISKIAEYPVANSKGAVIFIPQIHQNPGSSPFDTSNNDAVVAQKQILAVLKRLANNDGINFTMNEGDMYGPVSDEKMSDLKQIIVGHESLSADMAKLSAMQSGSSESSQISKTVSSIKSALPSIERVIILQGASRNLKAQDSSYVLYGSENKDTYEKSASLVRNYFYLQDRLSQLQGGSRNMYGTSLVSGSAQLTASTATQAQSGAVTSNLKALVSTAQTSGNQELASLANKMLQTIGSINKAMQAQNASSSDSPSRTSNPYASVTDPNQLMSAYRQTESQITEVVINQRNRETAANFVKALSATGKTIGILQYGAGHESGLVPELNKQGLNVLVVTVPQVSSGGQTQSSPRPTSQPVQPSYPTTPSYQQNPTAVSGYPSPYSAVNSGKTNGYGYQNNPRYNQYSRPSQPQYQRYTGLPKSLSTAEIIRQMMRGKITFTK